MNVAKPMYILNRQFWMQTWPAKYTFKQMNTLKTLEQMVESLANNRDIIVHGSELNLTISHKPLDSEDGYIVPSGNHAAKIKYKDLK